jgi:hypothetical protein
MRKRSSVEGFKERHPKRICRVCGERHGQTYCTSIARVMEALRPWVAMAMEALEPPKGVDWTPSWNRLAIFRMLILADRLVQLSPAMEDALDAIEKHLENKDSSAIEDLMELRDIRSWKSRRHSAVQ